MSGDQIQALATAAAVAEERHRSAMEFQKEAKSTLTEIARGVQSTSDAVTSLSSRFDLEAEKTGNRLNTLEDKVDRVAEASEKTGDHLILIERRVDALEQRPAGGGGMLAALAAMSPAKLTALITTIITAILGAVWAFLSSVGVV